MSIRTDYRGDAAALHLQAIVVGSISTRSELFLFLGSDEKEKLGVEFRHIMSAIPSKTMGKNKKLKKIRTNTYTFNLIHSI